jgi:hypothetical protein
VSPPEVSDEFDNVYWPQAVRDAVQLLMMTEDDDTPDEAYVVLIDSLVNDPKRMSALIVACIALMGSFIDILKERFGKPPDEFYAMLMDLANDAPPHKG